MDRMDRETLHTKVYWVSKSQTQLKGQEHDHEIPSMPTFWRDFFIINVCWILSNSFSVSLRMIIHFLFFNLKIWYITLIDLCVLKYPYIFGINPT